MLRSSDLGSETPFWEPATEPWVGGCISACMDRVSLTVDGTISVLAKMMSIRDTCKTS